MRIRRQGDYKSFFTNTFKTIRLTNGTPITPELEDVAINDKCLAACSYCYTNALKSGSNFENVELKAEKVWGSLPMNDRPFQIAIGGAGEPTMHPDFVSFLRTVKQLDIVPNYTTNGMHIDNNILKATEDYCGGVALSWHPHISKVFHKAIEQLKDVNTKLNVHIIIGDTQSMFDLEELYDRYSDIIDYFVILPYQAAGRAKELQVENIWKQCFEWINNTPNKDKFAFGALFHSYLMENEIPLKMSIYNPDIYSGYRIMDDNNYNKIFKSSYDLTEKTPARY